MGERDAGGSQGGTPTTARPETQDGTSGLSAEAKARVVEEAWGGASLEELMVRHLADAEFDMAAMGLDMTVQSVTVARSRCVALALPPGPLLWPPC